MHSTITFYRVSRHVINENAVATAPWAPSAWQFESAVLFVDVSGFTNLCTRLDVDALQRHINRYFTRLLDVVHTHGGDVLRFMGDAMLVTWARPLPPPAPALAPPPEAALLVKVES